MGQVNSSLYSHGRHCLEEGGHRRDWEEVNILVILHSYRLFLPRKKRLVCSLLWSNCKATRKFKYMGLARFI